MKVAPTKTKLMVINPGPLVLSILVMLAGLLVYWLTDQTKHPEAKEVGRIAFAFGLLATLLMYRR